MGNCVSKNRCNGREEKTFVDYNVICKVLENKTNCSSQNNNNSCGNNNNTNNGCKKVTVVRQPNWRDDYDNADCGCNNNTVENTCGCNNNYVENSCNCNNSYEETSCGCNPNHVYVNENNDCNCSYAYDYICVEENNNCNCNDNGYTRYNNEACTPKQPSKKSCKNDVKKEYFEVHCKCYKVEEDNEDCGCNNNNSNSCCNNSNNRRNKKSYNDYINWCNCN